MRKSINTQWRHNRIYLENILRLYVIIGVVVGTIIGIGLGYYLWN